MTENLDAYAKESGQDPAEIIRFYQENFKELFPVMDRVSVSGDAVDLFKKWEKEYSDGGNFSILDALLVFNELKLITAKGFENTILLLDYASKHGVIELDCSRFFRDEESSTGEEKISTNEEAADKTLYDRLLLAVYKEELFMRFCCFSAEALNKEGVDTQLEISERLSECSYEDLLDEAGIDCAGQSEESLLDSAEEYIQKFSISDDWRFNLDNINNFIRIYVMLFVQGAIDAETISPNQWQKLAENIWESLFHRLGGENNFYALIGLCSDSDEQPLEKFIASFSESSSHKEWEKCIQDSYLNLKKSVLLRTQIDAFPEDGSEWLIHDRKGSNAMYFSDLLNKRVLDLWRLTSWCDSFGQPIQYLRSEGGGYVCASWCHPDVDPTGDRGKESCYYFISDEGIAVVREFNEYLNLANERALNGAAMTIIQDVMGEYDMESVSTAFYQKTLHKAKSDFDQNIGQGSITREQLVNAMVNEWIVNCYCAPDEDDDPPEVKRKEFESMTNEELLESTGCDEIYTIQSFVSQYQRISDEYLQVFDSSSTDIKATTSREKSCIARVMDFLRRVRNKIRQLLNFD